MNTINKSGSLKRLQKATQKIREANEKIKFSLQQLAKDIETIKQSVSVKSRFKV